MKRAVCINAKANLLVTEIGKDGVEKRVLNKTLLAQLKALDIKELYLFANEFTGLRGDDFNKDGFKFYPTLVKLLEKEGFKVQSVVTPNDDYEKNSKLGQGYSEYLQALKRDNDVLKIGFNKYFKRDAEQHGNDAGKVQTQVMFRAFLQRKPKDLDSVIYLDSSEQQLSAVADIAQYTPSVKVSSYKIAPSDKSDLNNQTKFFLNELLKIQADTKSLGSKFRKADLTEVLAATKCKALLDGAEVSFSKQEYKALSSGKLGKLIATNPDLKAKVKELDPSAKPKTPAPESPSLR